MADLMGLDFGAAPAPPPRPSLQLHRDPQLSPVSTGKHFSMSQCRCHASTSLNGNPGVAGSFLKSSCFRCLLQGVFQQLWGHLPACASFAVQLSPAVAAGLPARQMVRLFQALCPHSCEPTRHRVC